MNLGLVAAAPGAAELEVVCPAGVDPVGAFPVVAGVTSPDPVETARGDRAAVESGRP
jgi:hypothetical protein